MQTTSTLAREKFEIDGKKSVHHNIILWTLELCDYPLTAWGMSKRCSLTYHQVDRRLKELRELRKIEIVSKKIDLDGAIRNAYKLV